MHVFGFIRGTTAIAWYAYVLLYTLLDVSFDILKYQLAYSSGNRHIYNHVVGQYILHAYVSYVKRLACPRYPRLLEHFSSVNYAKKIEIVVIRR